MTATAMDDKTYHPKEFRSQFSANVVGTTWKVAASYVTVMSFASVAASLAKFSNALVLSSPNGVIRESNPKRSDAPAYPAPPKTIEAKAIPFTA